jgi:hypothetical protein
VHASPPHIPKMMGTAVPLPSSVCTVLQSVEDEHALPTMPLVQVPQLTPDELQPDAAQDACGQHAGFKDSSEFRAPHGV